MNMDLTRRVIPVERVTKSKHGTENKNSRKRQQHLFNSNHDPTEDEIKSKPTFKKILQDTIEISEEGRKQSLESKKN